MKTNNNKYNILVLFVFIGVQFLLSAQSPQWYLANGSEGMQVSDIALYTSDPDTLYALGYPAFLRSVDRGETWDSVSAAITLQGDIAIDPVDSKKIYLSHNILPTEGIQVYISTNGGVRWDSLFIELAPHIVDWPIIEIDPGDRATVYVNLTPSNAGVGTRLYRTSDHGITWDSLSTPDAIHMKDLAIAPSNNQVLYVTYGWPLSTKMYKSTDRSQTWTQVPFPYNGTTILAVHPWNPDIVYAAILSGEAEGVYKTVNGGYSWEPKNTGLDSLHGYNWIQALVINPQNPTELFLCANDLYRTENGGEQWVHFSDLAINALVLDTLNDRMYASAAQGIYYYDSLSTTGTSVENPWAHSFTLAQNYPNPFNTSTRIPYMLTQDSYVHITVYDITGRQVTELVNEYKTVGTHFTTFRPRNLPSGIYIYRLVKGSEEEFHKMMFLK